MYENRLNYHKEEDEMTLGKIMARRLKGETFEEYKIRILRELNSRDFEEDTKYKMQMCVCVGGELLFGSEELIALTPQPKVY